MIGEKELTVGALVACTILTGRALAPLASIAAMLTRLQQSRIALKALDAVMKVETERSNEKGFVHRDKLEGSIEFKNVDFSYPESQTKAIDDVSFKIQPGEKVGVIGRIGSGPLPENATVTEGSIDANGDGFGTALDALVVINRLETEQVEPELMRPVLAPAQVTTNQTTARRADDEDQIFGLF